jgi:hypothetical protein
LCEPEHTLILSKGRAIAQAVSRRLSTVVAGKAVLRQVFPEYFGFPYQFSFYRLLHIHHLSSGAGTIGQLLADIPSEISLTPPQETKTKNCCKHENVV